MLLLLVSAAAVLFACLRHELERYDGECRAIALLQSAGARVTYDRDNASLPLALSDDEYAMLYHLPRGVPTPAPDAIGLRSRRCASLPFHAAAQAIRRDGARGTLESLTVLPLDEHVLLRRFEAGYVRAVCAMSPTLKAEARRRTEMLDAMGRDLAHLRAQLARSPPIREDHLDDEFLEALGQLPSLRFIRAMGTPIDDRAIARLVCHREICALGLAFTDVTDAGVTLLSAQHRLEYLDLTGTQVTDAGLRALATLPRLREIRLSATRISDDGLELLSSVATLERLYVDWTPVTELGLRMLSRRARLRFVAVTDFATTRAGGAQLRSRLPKCTVVFHLPVCTECIECDSNVPGVGWRRYSHTQRWRNY